MALSLSLYRKKLRGCFIGKAVGGTLGMPMEGGLETRPFTFYDPVPTGMVANDDLDLQVVWLECLRKHGLPVNRHHLAEAWLEHMRCVPDEYGVAFRNLSQGIWPPLSGRRENHFTDGMGAAIRSEIWAALAPGDPELAVRLCREDAVVDHDGCGVESCVFLTAIESAAYLESDREKLIERALGFLRPDGRLAGALRDVALWWGETPDYLAVRAKILEKYRVDNWTDVSINLSLILLAWYAGAGDFGRSICIAAEMGYDADCTCATLGAILGLIAPDAIDSRWTAPLGDALLLSDCIVAMHPADTIGEFCVQVEAMAGQVQRYYESAVRFDAPPAVDSGAAAPWAGRDVVSLPENYDPRASLLMVEPIVVSVLPETEGDLTPGVPRRFTLTAQNVNGPLDGELTLVAPYGFSVTPARFRLTDAPLTFEVCAPARGCLPRSFLHMIFELGGLRFTADMGLPTVMPWKLDGQNWDGGFTTRLPAGAHELAIDLFAPYTISAAAILCEGTRPVTVMLDGEEILRHQADQYVPAVHRSGHRAVLELACGRHSIVLRFADGGAGEFVFGVADPRSWIWHPDLRYEAVRA